VWDGGGGEGFGYGPETYGPDTDQENIITDLSGSEINLKKKLLRQGDKIYSFSPKMYN
jgi:hypothetical protein